MILTIWTFLDILKMSIFGFLDEMFFRRTEKSGLKMFITCRTENGKEIFIKIKDFLKIPKFQKSRNRSWLHYGYIMATFDNVAKT